MTTRVALTVRFRKWRRRDSWTCLECGSSVVDADQHASWHASSSGASEGRPLNCGKFSERQPIELTVMVDEQGGTIK